MPLAGRKDESYIGASRWLRIGRICRKVRFGSRTGLRPKRCATAAISRDRRFRPRFAGLHPGDFARRVDDRFLNRRVHADGELVLKVARLVPVEGRSSLAPEERLHGVMPAGYDVVGSERRGQRDKGLHEPWRVAEDAGSCKSGGLAAREDLARRFNSDSAVTAGDYKHAHSLCAPYWPMFRP